MLEEKLGSAAMEVELEKGSRAGVRLTQSRCRWKPLWQGEELAGIALSLDVKGDLGEVQGNADLSEARVWEQMREQLEKKVEGEVREVLEHSRRAGEDFLHLQRKMRVQCPGRYRKMDENWEEWFPELEMRVQVHAVLERSYDLNEGAGI
jgi:spore germination protein KC